MLTVETKVTRIKKKFNFDASKFVKESLGIIKADIQQGIVDRRQIDGSSMPTLEPITVAMKEESQGFGRVRQKVKSEQRATRDLNQRRAGVAVSPDHPLIDTGNLLKNQIIEAEGPEGTLRIGPERAQIAKELQIDGVGRKSKRFIFFGISKTAEENIRKLLKIRWRESFEMKRG